MSFETIAVDRTSWGRLRVTGGDCARFLQGLTTVNIDALAAGAHGWGAILSPKGRVLSVIDVARVPEGFVVACEAALADKTRELLERYAVMDDVGFEPLGGPDRPAYQLWSDPASVWTAPIVAAADAAPPGPLRPDVDPEVERLRIRGGFLRYGADIDEDHFPFETPLARFLDYGKGCYVGQEPVFRVHSQGNTAWLLRGLMIEGGSSVASGTALTAPAKGTVTSSVVDGSATRALAYLHRSSWEPGTAVTVEGRSATVHELPW